MGDDLEAMAMVLESFGKPAYGDDPIDDVAEEWLMAGFAPDDAGQWLEVGCYYPRMAQMFTEADIAPSQIPLEVWGAIDSGLITPSKVTLKDLQTLIQGD